MLKSYGKLSSRTMRARRMLPTKDIMFSLISLIALSNLMMRLWFGVKQIEDLEHIRKILHSLRRLDYDLVISILFEKELNTFTPNLVLNKGDHPWSLQQHQTKSFTFFTIYSELASKQAKMLKNMVIKGSSSEEGRRGCKPMLLKWWKKKKKWTPGHSSKSIKWTRAWRK